MDGQSGGSVTLAERVEELERQLHEVTARLATMEAPASPHGPLRAPQRPAHPPARPVTGVPAVQQPPPAEPARTSTPPPAASPSAAPRGLHARARALELEDLLGGRVLAWTGGLAVVIAVALFFGVAVSNGWIGEEARTALAGLGSLALACAGVYLAERRGRNDAALAASAAGVAGLFLTVAVGAQVYAVLAPAVALPLALVIGASATAVALRWSSQGIAALGLLGGLAAPALVGAPSDAVSLWLLWIAAACTAAVLVYQGWPRLMLPAFALTSVQWAEWLEAGQPEGAALLALAGFGTVTIASATGEAVRTGSARLPVAAAALLALNAFALTAGGLFALEGTLADGWVTALAVVHLAAGTWGGARVTGALRLVLLAVGAVLGDVALGLVLDGVALTVAYAATVAVAGAVARRTPRRGDDGELLLGWVVAGQALLAAGHALTVAPPELALGGGAGPGGFLAPLAVAVACLGAGRLALPRRETWSAALDGLGLAAVAYLATVLLDGAWLAAAWSALAVALLPFARAKPGGPPTGDRVAAGGVLGFLGLALCHALAFEAPPAALVDGLDEVLAAMLALGTLVAAATLAARVRIVDPRAPLRTQAGPGAEEAASPPSRFAVDGAPGLRAALACLAGLTTLFLASTLLVTPFQPGPGDPGTALLDLPVRQQGQVLLSALWAIVGVAILAGGLVRDLRILRLGGLALLGVAVAKVVAYDLATLTALYRVASFLALGLLLLAGAFLWQRARPPRSL